jgi:hypothetical protein
LSSSSSALRDAQGRAEPGQASREDACCCAMHAAPAPRIDASWQPLVRHAPTTQQPGPSFIDAHHQHGQLAAPRRHIFCAHRWFFKCGQQQCDYWKWADALPGYPDLTALAGQTQPQTPQQRAPAAGWAPTGGHRSPQPACHGRGTSLLPFQPCTLSPPGQLLRGMRTPAGTPGGSGGMAFRQRGSSTVTVTGGHVPPAPSPQQQPPQWQQPQQQQHQPSPGSGGSVQVKLGPGDNLALHFRFNPDLNQAVKAVGARCPCAPAPLARPWPRPCA